MNVAVPKAISSCGGPRVLVLGYGNPGRQDDGLGPAAAAGIEALGWPHLKVQDNYQLNIEDAIDVAEHDIVWFVDAAKTGPEPYAVQELSPASSFEFTSHVVRPEVILSIARRHFGRSPQAFLLAIRGYEFEFIEELTTGASNNLRVALAMLTERLRVLYQQVAS
jgi:hydrogenase maturation protease